MPTHTLHRPTTSMPRMAVLLGLSQLVLTSIHHAYGAYAYDTPWRLQVVGFSVIVALVIIGLSLAAHRRRGNGIGRLALWLNMGLILIVPVLAIGLVEGGYNHFVKNVVYFAGDLSLYSRIFPSPLYEVPTDWFFEVTGVAQLALGLWAGRAALRALVAPRLATAAA